MGKAASSIDLRKLSRQVEQDRQASIANDTARLLDYDQDQDLVLQPVTSAATRNKQVREKLASGLASTEEGEQAMLRAIAAKNPAKAAALTAAGPI